MDALGSVQQQNYRNMKDFLLLYNKLTEQCFSKCVTDFNRKKASEEEAWCVNQCADRYVAYNQRLMFTFMEYQNIRQDAIVKELEKNATNQQNQTITSPVTETVSSQVASPR